MIRGILITVLTLGLIGTGVWGYQEHRDKNAILMNAENNYQRAFHDLTYQMDILHDKIGTTLAMNSKKSLSPALAEVWRITSEAHNGVGQLPLALLPFNKTEEFLTKIGDFSYRTAVRDLDNEPLTKEEYKTLKNLHKQSANIQQELRRVQHLVLKNNLRWMDVEMALASGKEASDNTIIDGFKTVEKTVESYDETNMSDPTLADFNERDKNFANVKGKKISKDKAVQVAKKYANIKQPKDTKVTSNGDGSNFGFYSVSFVDENGHEATMDITKKGGYPIWFINHREIGNESNISLNDASEKAKAYLKENNFKDMILAESTQYDNVGLFTFVTSQDNVLIYPESVKLKVALDNGEIVGLAADDYLQSNKKRKLAKPTISKAEAKKKINPNVKVMEDRLAVITNELKEDILCYEFLGVLDDESYRIFINAENGMEEKVERLQEAEPIYDDIL